jgi:hypothetical protein
MEMVLAQLGESCKLWLGAVLPSAKVGLTLMVLDLVVTPGRDLRNGIR